MVWTISHMYLQCIDVDRWTSPEAEDRAGLNVNFPIETLLHSTSNLWIWEWGREMVFSYLGFSLFFYCRHIMRLLYENKAQRDFWFIPLVLKTLLAWYEHQKEPWMRFESPFRRLDCFQMSFQALHYKFLDRSISLTEEDRFDLWFSQKHAKLIGNNSIWQQ